MKTKNKIIVEFKEDCDMCFGKGYLHSNDKEGKYEIQKCDDCNKFKNDLDAQRFYKYKY